PARRAERRPHPNQLHDVSPMSCEENKKAERRSRSLAIVQDPPPAPAPRYWRSLEERAGSPELADASKREFPAGASELTDSVSRRSFMQLIGTSAALAGAGVACMKP